MKERSTCLRKARIANGTSGSSICICPHITGTDIPTRLRTACGVPEKAAVTVKQENKEWIFKFSMVDWGVFSTWNPDPTGTGNTLIIEFRGKADKYSGSKPNDLADDFYE